MTAYLYIELKNNGDRNVANLAFEIKYYDKMDCLIKRAVIKNALNDSLPKNETKKYNIRLRGDYVNLSYENYPYSRQDEVSDFDVKIIGIKLASK